MSSVGDVKANLVGGARFKSKEKVAELQATQSGIIREVVEVDRNRGVFYLPILSRHELRALSLPRERHTPNTFNELSGARCPRRCRWPR